MIHVLSLGAGVQSTTLALMAAHGEVTPMPTAAIFADTQRELAATYRHLDWLTPRLPFPVYRPTAGDLGQHILDAVTPGSTQRMDARPPFYVDNGLDSGQLNRQCTDRYKLRIIRRQTATLAGIPRGSRGPTEPVVTQWIAISRDEYQRMKPSQKRWIVHRWPLVDLGMTRWDCKAWLTRHDYPVPPRSACTFCPYHSDAEWRIIRDEHPADWAEAVALDHAIRHGVASSTRERSRWFLHRTLQPLDQVDLSTPEDHGQLTLFDDECAGICGV